MIPRLRSVTCSNFWMKYLYKYLLIGCSRTTILALSFLNSQVIIGTNSSASCLPSPAASSIQHIRRMLKMGTMDLMENADDFAEFVNELKDYAWRLNKEERYFLDCVLRLHRELVANVSFIIAAEDVQECHKEVTEALTSQIGLTKESMKLQEEIVGLCFSKEKRVDEEIASLQNELKPLLKRKHALQGEIHEDVTKLIVRSHSLMELLGKQEELGEDLKQIEVNSARAKRCKRAIEEMHLDAVMVAKKLDAPVVN
ncbi:hypothetical protein L195_g032792 [Trifolium pratense]|uniref:Uncharacterized protein n=1 Tax=Trifolium pratense TaxID=57577 RepID=A0A2K3LE62_TRIPR|nr:hypothetical protein L195_g032792 [Trifolium pratense]